MVTYECGKNGSVVLSFNNITVLVIPGVTSITRGNEMTDLIDGDIITLSVEATVLPNVVLGEIIINKTAYSIKEYVESFGETTDGKIILANFTKFASRVSKAHRGE